jgi:hypothetical protein
MADALTADGVPPVRVAGFVQRYEFTKKQQWLESATQKMQASKQEMSGQDMSDFAYHECSGCPQKAKTKSQTKIVAASIYQALEVPHFLHGRSKAKELRYLPLYSFLTSPLVLGGLAWVLWAADF